MSHECITIHTPCIVEHYEQGAQTSCYFQLLAENVVVILCKDKNVLLVSK